MHTNLAPAKKKGAYIIILGPGRNAVASFFNCVLPPRAIAYTTHWALNCISLVERVFACKHILFPAQTDGAYIIISGPAKNAVSCMSNCDLPPKAIACIIHWAPNCIDSWGLVEKAIACILNWPIAKKWIHNHHCNP